MLDAMKAIDGNWREVVFVKNSGDKVVGVITDGDLRRGLLRGFDLNTRVTKIMTKKYYYVHSGIDRNLLLDLMKARQIRHVPVLDEGYRLLGIHFLQDLIGACVKPNVAVLMAGGKGTRLRPLTDNVPKPLVPVAGRPILERLVLHLVGHGIRTIYLSINYLGHMIEEYFGDGSKFGCDILYIREDKELGTAGALSSMPEKPGHPFIVLNGDLVTQANISKLLQFHESNAAGMTLAMKEYHHAIPYGVIEFEGNRLTAFKEKPRQSHFINSGIYVLEPSMLRLIEPGVFFPMNQLIEKCVAKGIDIAVYPLEEEWQDVGVFEELKRANAIADEGEMVL